MNGESKDEIIAELLSCLAGDVEIRRVVVFGSFLTLENPADMDAVFQDSADSYLTLAMKYR